jgi:DNA modification methylase
VEDGARLPSVAGWVPGNPGSVSTLPCIVLDPFIGSGTTALVARRLGRKCVGIELSPEYAHLCLHRTRQLSLLAEVTA